MATTQCFEIERQGDRWVVVMPDRRVEVASSIEAHLLADIPVLVDEVTDGRLDAGFGDKLERVMAVCKRETIKSFGINRLEDRLKEIREQSQDW